MTEQKSRIVASDGLASPWRSAPASWVALAVLMGTACKDKAETSESATLDDTESRLDSEDTDPETTSGDSGDDTQRDTDPDESADPCAELHAVASRNHRAGRIPFDLQLDGSDSCGPLPIVSWDWEIAEEALSGAAVSWVGLSEGTYTATLTVTDAEGAQAGTTLSVEVLPGACPTVLDPIELGELEDPDLVESSGLIVSRRDADVLWTHNDSGDRARLFATGRDGSALGTWTLDVVDGDWEDLAWGEDPETGAPLLFVGDVGDFGLARETVLVYVLDEPEVDASAEPAEHSVETFRTLTLQLPELLNIDSMLVDPVTGDLILISDETDGRSVVMRKPAPHTDGDDVTLEVVGELSFGSDALPGDVLATGADISPLGDRIVIRTLDESWLWLRDGSESVAEALLREPCAVPLPAQTLGESVTFDIREGGLLVTSEGAGEPVWRVPFYEEPECIDTLEAVITATPPGGPLPVDVVFDASASCVPEGLAEARWDIDGELLSGESVEMSWLASGAYPVTLTIVDTLGDEAETSTIIEVEAGDCPEDDGTEVLGTVGDDELVETSGIVTSRIDPDLLWVHNDSGHAPQLYALSRDGTTLGTWTLDAPSGDLEDIAASYAEDGTPELWVGDIGDNLMEREQITLYRLNEPEVPAGDAEDHTVTEFDEITLTYPDGARNAETLMVDPVTRDVYILTKDYDGNSELYRKAAPHADGETAELEYVTSLTFGTGALSGAKPTTAGDFSPNGAWIIVRTYGSTAFLWPRDRSATVDDAFAADPCPITLPSEPQGEAICFDTDGDALLTVSEREYQPIYRIPLVR